jgi:hypothetical protein
MRERTRFSYPQPVCALLLQNGRKTKSKRWGFWSKLRFFLFG